MEAGACSVTASSPARWGDEVPTGDVETRSFPDAAAWEAWLGDHHDLLAGVWLKIAKKGSILASVTVAEALDVALCYGWLDSHRMGLDAPPSLQKSSPRRPRRSWSTVNVDKVDAL